MSVEYVADGVRKLKKAEDISVFLPYRSGWKRAQLIVVRDGNPVCLMISNAVAAELIAAGIPYQG
jgi:hypothetical protein